MSNPPKPPPQIKQIKKTPLDVEKPMAFTEATKFVQILSYTKSPSSKYWQGWTLLSFADQTSISVFNVIWSLEAILKMATI